MYKQITIVFCLPGRTFSNNFLLCWSELLMTCIKNNINPLVSCSYDSNVNFVRSKCLGYDVLRGKDQKPFDGKLDYDYIMWIDSDIIFKIEEQREQLVIACNKSVQTNGLINDICILGVRI